MLIALSTGSLCYLQMRATVFAALGKGMCTLSESEGQCCDILARFNDSLVCSADQLSVVVLLYPFVSQICGPSVQFRTLFAAFMMVMIARLTT